jgi:hypothetical protein
MKCSMIVPSEVVAEHLHARACAWVKRLLEKCEVQDGKVVIPEELVRSLSNAGKDYQQLNPIDRSILRYEAMMLMLAITRPEWHGRKLVRCGECSRRVNGVCENHGSECDADWGCVEGLEAQ